MRQCNPYKKSAPPYSILFMAELEKKNPENVDNKL